MGFLSSFWLLACRISHCPSEVCDPSQSHIKRERNLIPCLYFNKLDGAMPNLYCSKFLLFELPFSCGKKYMICEQKFCNTPSFLILTAVCLSISLISLFCNCTCKYRTNRDFFLFFFFLTLTSCASTSVRFSLFHCTYLCI